jgi:hypothetical protein
MAAAGGEGRQDESFPGLASNREHEVIVTFERRPADAPDYA